MSASKSWQARIAEAADALSQSFVESISYDRRLYKQDIAGSIAHARMLASASLISVAERDAIIQGLHDIERDIEAGQFTFDESLEDIHMVVEAALIQRIGQPGQKLHTGRSRNDQVALDLQLWIRQECYGAAQDRLLDLQRALWTLAGRSVEVVMPSYTHLQRAQPISAAAECLAWIEMFNQDQRRLFQAGQGYQQDGLQSPLGSGAIAGCSLPLRPEMTARELGIDLPPGNSIERTASRDQACDMLFSLTMIAQHLSRLAEQWIIYCSTEFSFLKIADRHTTGSSMMPQKRNPDLLELIRGRCAAVHGDLVALLTILKGLPIGYNRDLQEDKRILFRAYDTTMGCVAMAAAIVDGASFVNQKIEPTLDRGFLDATSLAEYLVTAGVPFRTAHQIVGSLVARCEKEGKTALSQLTLHDFQQEAQERGATAAAIKQDVFEALGAANVVKRYQSPGAAGGRPLQAQLATWKKRLGL